MKVFDFGNMIGHNWEKINLVTLKNSGDHYQCKNCKIKGYRPAFTDKLQFDGRISVEKIKICEKGLIEKVVGRKVVVTLCTAVGQQFENLTPRSEHIVIEAPEPYSNDSEGVWVMGIGEPVKLLNNEFNFL